jgi:hypothetical protein
MSIKSKGKFVLISVMKAREWMNMCHHIFSNVALDGVEV